MVWISFLKENCYLQRQILSTLASCLLTTCGGMTMGISAVMIPQIKQDGAFPNDASTESWIASISMVPMMVGCLIIGPILEATGRKVAHVMFIIPHIIGWLLMAFATNVPMMLTGRFITGILLGACRPISLVYIGEITDPKYRSVTLFFSSVAAHLGVLSVHAIGSYFHWRTAVFACIIPTVATFFILLFIKESPLWLISKGRIDEGIVSFRWYRGTGEDAEKELALVLKRSDEKSPKVSIKDWFGLIFDRSLAKPFVLVIFLMAALQFNGTNILNFYAIDIFRKIFSDEVDAVTLMLVSDAIRIILSICMCATASKMPRRKSLLSFSLIVLLSLVSIVLFIYDITPFNSIYLSVSCIVIYIISANAIWTLSWSIVPEIFPNNLRGFGTGLASTIAATNLFVIVKCTPGILTTYGEGVLYSIFAVTTLICTVVLYFIVPETNGKTLQAIEDSFANKNIVNTTHTRL
ncbi:facilitated trehalose transporter Tret1-like [Anticarsia gemmatalis]|uniref:facilitated trehalose transporter Tret1-like n=1 Tax=Anticarsia gemmatalis TaxID=129554 RepID=UPI003F76F4B7